MHRVTALLLAACLGGSTLLGATVAPAVASERPYRSNTLELSLDGVHWADAITTPLFDPALRWVPGDVRDETFYVRNTMPDAGSVQVVVDRSTDEVLRDTGWLSLSARAAGGAWTRIDTGGRHVLVDDDQLAGRGAVAVQVRAAFDPDAPNGTMVLDSDLAFDVVISEAAPGQSGAGPVGDDTLPDTGSEVPAWLAPLATLLVAGGLVLVVRRRRESDEARHG